MSAPQLMSNATKIETDAAHIDAASFLSDYMEGFAVRHQTHPISGAIFVLNVAAHSCLAKVDNKRTAELLRCFAQSIEAGEPHPDAYARARELSTEIVLIAATEEQVRT